MVLCSCDNNAVAWSGHHSVEEVLICKWRQGWRGYVFIPTLSEGTSVYDRVWLHVMNLSREKGAAGGRGASGIRSMPARRCHAWMLSLLSQTVHAWWC